MDSEADAHFIQVERERSDDEVDAEDEEFSNEKGDGKGVDGYSCEYVRSDEEGMLWRK